MKARLLTFIFAALTFFSFAQAPVIYKPSHAGRIENLAALELRRYLYLHTGVLGEIRMLSAAKAAGGKSILMGRWNAMRSSVPEMDFPVTLGDEGYALRSLSGDRLLITGHTELAVLYGVYHFLESTGIRFDLTTDVIPDKKLSTVNLAGFNELCRAALYAGSIAKYGTVQSNGIVGIPSAQAAAYFTKSYDAATAIKNSGKFALYNGLPSNKVQNFKNVFLVKGPSGNTEAIMAKTHNAGTVSSGNPWGWDYGQSPKPNPIDQGNINAPYLEMAEEFEYTNGTPGKLDRTAIQTGLYTTGQLWANKDPRFFATFWTANATWKGTYVDPHNGLVLPGGAIQGTGTYNGIVAQGPQRAGLSLDYGTSFGVMKYLDSTVAVSTLQLSATSTTDYLIFRYGETLLNLAEAAFELGKTAEALDAINQIRTRAGIATLTSIDMDKIRHERKVELAFENHRYWVNANLVETPGY